MFDSIERDVNDAYAWELYTLCKSKQLPIHPLYGTQFLIESFEKHHYVVGVSVNDENLIQRLHVRGRYQPPAPAFGFFKKKPAPVMLRGSMPLAQDIRTIDAKVVPHSVDAYHCMMLTAFKEFSGQLKPYVLRSNKWKHFVKDSFEALSVTFSQKLMAGLRTHHESLLLPAVRTNTPPHHGGMATELMRQFDQQAYRMSMIKYNPGGVASSDMDDLTPQMLLTRFSRLCVHASINREWHYPLKLTYDDGWRNGDSLFVQALGAEAFEHAANVPVPAPKPIPVELLEPPHYS